MILKERESPRPLPFALVVKNGVNIFSITSFDMPQPLSFTSTEAILPPLYLSSTRWKSVSILVFTIISPFLSIASTLFFTRFKNTWVNCSLSPMTSGRLGSYTFTMLTPFSCVICCPNKMTVSSTSCIFIGIGFILRGFAKSRTSSRILLSLSTSLTIISVYSASSGVFLDANLLDKSWAAPRIPPNGFFTSWATPAANVPKKASLSFLTDSSLMDFMPERSFKRTAAPIMLPLESSMADVLTLTGTAAPIL